jgi:hypothetical protein
MLVHSASTANFQQQSMAADLKPVCIVTLFHCQLHNSSRGHFQAPSSDAVHPGAKQHPTGPAGKLLLQTNRLFMFDRIIASSTNVLSRTAKRGTGPCAGAKAWKQNHPYQPLPKTGQRRQCKSEKLPIATCMSACILQNFTSACLLQLF